MARLAAAAALAALALTIAPGGASASPDTLYGIHPQAPLTDDDLEVMRDAGIDAVRGMIPWAAVEPQPGTYDWSAIDDAVRSLAAYGIEPVLYLYGTPDWAAFRDGRSCVPGGKPDCATFLPLTDETRTAFAAFARAAVERYGPDGDFWTEGDPSCGLPFAIPVICAREQPPCGCDEPAPVSTWQIWSEPNSPKYTAPNASPRAYAAMLGPAAEAIRAADADAEIILGGIWGPRRKPGEPRAELVPVGDFLRRLYRVPGIESSFDAVAVHPYSGTVRGVLDQIADARRAVRRAGDDVPTYLTEIGWASEGPKRLALVKDRGGQAQMLYRTFSALADRRRAFRLRGVFWYTWRDGGGAGICAWCAGAGLRTAAGAPKPAWYELTKFTGGSE